MDKQKAVIEQQRDFLIRQLWCVFNELSYLQKINDWHDEDINLWTFVTGHSAIQGRLDKATQEIEMMTYNEALQALEKAQQTSWSWDRFEYDNITQAIEVFKRMKIDLEEREKFDRETAKLLFDEY